MHVFEWVTLIIFVDDWHCEVFFFGCEKKTSFSVCELSNNFGGVTTSSPQPKKNYDHVNITCGMVNRAARQVHHNLKVTERHMVTIPAKTTWKFVNIFSWILCPNQPKPRYHVVKKPTKLTLNNHHRQATKPNYPITNNKQSPLYWLAPAKTFGSSLEEV